jgi:hypothetical protein
MVGSPTLSLIGLRTPPWPELVETAGLVEALVREETAARAQRVARAKSAARAQLAVWAELAVRVESALGWTPASTCPSGEPAARVEAEALGPAERPQTVQSAVRLAAEELAAR